MQKVINVYKPFSKTPLEIINDFRSRFPEYKNLKIGYAGRLDPMAEGILLLLIDDANNKRKMYELSEKEYEFDLVLGLITDSYDIMGMISDFSDYNHTEIIKKLKNVIPTFIGNHDQPYPPYSSPRINGKSLFYWARQNKLNEITIPTKTIEIFSFSIERFEEIYLKDIVSIAKQRISRVHGDFRQKEILQKWSETLEKHQQKSLLSAHIKIHCSSGTYIRSLAHEIGQQLQIGGTALNIKRTRVGSFLLKDSLKFT